MDEEAKVRHKQLMSRLGNKISSGLIPMENDEETEVLSMDYLAGYRDAVQDILKLKGDE